MKLPVKLLTAVAALALLAVGVISVQNAGSTAQAAVTGSVHLTNKWSTLTTNASPPSGRTFVGSGQTLYASMADKTSGGTAQNVIMANSDTLIISVSDADIDVPITATQVGATAVVADGGTFNITVPFASGNTPIISTSSEVIIRDVATNTNQTALGDFTVISVNPGTPAANGSIFVANNSGAGIDPADYYAEFETSAVDGMNVSITTTVQTTPITVRLTETGRSTGVFEGLVQLIDAESATVPSSATTAFTAIADCGAAVPAACNTGKALVLDNSLVTVKYDDASGTGGSAVSVTQTSRVEVSAPTPVVSSPSNGSAVQVRRPSFSGTVSDTGSGLDISEIKLYHDNSDDPTNTTAVLTTSAPGINLGAITAVTASGGAVANTPTFTGSPVDGATSVSWSFTPAGDIPTVGTPPPDHIVDFQVVAADRAGNVGFSDSNTSTTGAGVGTGNKEPHTVKVDQKIPSISDAQTGKFWDAVTSTVKSNDRKSIQVIFDDNVAGVDNTDFEVKLVSGTTLVPIAAQVVSSMPTSVFLTLGVDLPSSDTPTITVVGQISDAAGNTTSAGSKVARDFLAPVVTVTLSGGSGTGTGTSGPSGLTKKTMVIDVLSDENLSTTPTVQIFNSGSTTVAEGTVTAIAQGANLWRATFDGTGFTDGATAKKSVVVTATDASTQANVRTSGNSDVTSSSARTFTLDKTVPTLVNAGGTVTTSQRKPFVVIEFTDAHTVTVNVANVGSTDVLTMLATTDNKKFFYVPGDDLALGNHTVEAKATDLAGNEGTQQTYTLTITERKTFDLQLFAGWNAKSFPSDPVDPSIGSVFTETGIDQVVRYDATDTASPWRIATRDAVSGAWTSSTATPLNTIRAGAGYWVHTNNFAPQAVELVGEVTPGAGSPPPVVTIPTARGWNFVGVVSQSRTQTEGASGASLTRVNSVGGTVVVTVADYFGTVNQGRVYRYDSATLSFRELTAGDAIQVGEALWVFISPQADGSLPAIVP